MQRAYSFSKIGISLDKNLHDCLKAKDQDKLKNILRSRSLKLVNTHGKMNNDKKKAKKYHHEENDNFKKTISRKSMSTFQKCHTKVQNVNAIYNEKITLTKQQNPFYSMKRFNPPSYFQTAGNFYKTFNDEENEKLCNKFLRTFRSTDLGVKTQDNLAMETMKSLKNSHILQFEKQTQRPFYVYLKKLDEEYSIKKPSVIESRDNQTKLQTLRKTHAFQSYSERDLLNPQKISKFSSALNSHEVDINRYKQKKIQSHIKFDKFLNQIRTRYDRDSPAWVTKLQYDPKQEIKKKQNIIRTFSKQTRRKLNEVHSKYPIRIAM